LAPQIHISTSATLSASSTLYLVKHRTARQGRNPRTGETVFVEEKYVPFFKTGKELRERLNRGYNPGGAVKDSGFSYGNS